ncbi:MAG: phosphoribosylglycinamide formyltransferase [Lachnospiraceae bacterium]|nr:phosphoribosylglycinamide formyltransferase [Lachnospiraceae bacterium]
MLARQRIAVLVSGGGTNLQKLMDAQSDGLLPDGEIVLVISNRKAAYALTRARERGIPTVVLSKAMEPDRDRYDEKLLAILTENRIDVIALAGFLGIVGKRVLSAYPDRIVNIHPALIPSFCGMGYYGLAVHEAALKRGVKLTGATAHLVTDDVDGGPILLQKAVEVLPGDTPEVLQLRVMEQAEWVIFPQAVEMVCRKCRFEEA